MEKDIIIIGGGPAGLTSAIYTSRARHSTLVIEEKAIGGQIIITTEIENYPGFPKGIMGPELAMLMEEQAKKFGTEIIFDSVKLIDLDNKKIITENSEYKCKALIIATGATPSKLNLPKEEELTGRGISYCATCDGAFFRDQVVAVVGGGNTAVEEALFLTNFAQKVYLIHRRDRLRAEKCLQERVFEHKKIEIIWNTIIDSIEGQESLRGVNIKNKITGETTFLPLDGLFIFVGYTPKTEFLKNIVDLDENGYIKVNNKNQTSIPWIFAAGDCVLKPYKQIATAVGDGCTAALSAIAYLEGY
ncbi:MAG: thioredoxin-disulfide reductase [Proteobacteria bacterium]|nr:thioredoxin-disulfide reductase [Pseudomonadota bacterium]